MAPARSTSSPRSTVTALLKASTWSFAASRRRVSVSTFSSRMRLNISISVRACSISVWAPRRLVLASWRKPASCWARRRSLWSSRAWATRSATSGMESRGLTR